MKQLALEFVLNTGEIRKTHELDYNAYFAVLTFETEELKKLYDTWEEESDTSDFPANLASALYANALRFRFIKIPLLSHETVESAMFGHFCLCDQDQPSNNV